MSELTNFDIETEEAFENVKFKILNVGSNATTTSLLLTIKSWMTRFNSCNFKFKIW